MQTLPCARGSFSRCSSIRYWKSSHYFLVLQGVSPNYSKKRRTQSFTDRHFQNVLVKQMHRFPLSLKIHFLSIIKHTFQNFIICGIAIVPNPDSRIRYFALWAFSSWGLRKRETVPVVPSAFRVYVNNWNYQKLPNAWGFFTAKLALDLLSVSLEGLEKSIRIDFLLAWPVLMSSFTSGSPSKSKVWSCTLPHIRWYE